VGAIENYEIRGQFYIKFMRSQLLASARWPRRQQPPPLTRRASCATRSVRPVAAASGADREVKFGTNDEYSAPHLAVGRDRWAQAGPCAGSPSRAPTERLIMTRRRRRPPQTRQKGLAGASEDAVPLTEPVICFALRSWRRTRYLFQTFSFRRLVGRRRPRRRRRRKTERVPA
jgi:hypothetical protein